MDLVTTDGFLYPNRILQERSLIARKGFPESYDRSALISFLASVKAGNPHAKAPRVLARHLRHRARHLR